MAFRFDKFTIKAQEAVQRAQELAADHGNPQIDALASAGRRCWPKKKASSSRCLEKIGVNRAQLDRIVEAEIESLAQSQRRPKSHPSASARR